MQVSANQMCKKLIQHIAIKETAIGEWNLTLNADISGFLQGIRSCYFLNIHLRSAICVMEVSR